MGAAVLAQAEFTSGGSVATLTLRQRCELIRGQAETERASFISHWKELNDFILPRRGRFYVSDVNKGDRRSRSIVDSTATTSARTLSAGMMSGVTSPARPWFRLTTPDPDVNSLDSVKVWLYEVNRRMEIAFVRSNLYNALPLIYSDMGVFGTAAVAMEEDDEHVFRFYTFPVGSYALYNDQKLRVRTFVRTFRLTVQQVVAQWGAIDDQGRPNFLTARPTTISPTVQNLWRRGALGVWIDLVHLVQPNASYDGSKIDAKFKRFESVYYEVGAPGTSASDYQHMGVLEHSGYDEFPVFTPRWETNSEDIYATNCPGMTALGDIKELQLRTKRMAQATEKMINPPMTGPSVLKTAKASLLPGDITYVDVRDGTQGFRPVHEINFAAAFGPIEQGSTLIRQRIERVFFADLFLMLAEMDRREITATEIAERKEEKLLALGPMLEQLNQDLLDPLIDRAFNIMARKGLMPPAPPEIQGTPLRVEYVSIMAQAQKMVGLQSLERFAGFAGQAAQYDPSIIDIIDGDEMIRDYADAVGMPPKVVRSPDAVQQLRDARQKAQQQQQAAENAPGIAGAVKDLSQSPTDGNNALATLVGRTTARRTVNATTGPAPAPAGGAA